MKNIDIKTKEMKEINEYDGDNGDEMKKWDWNMNISDLYDSMVNESICNCTLECVRSKSFAFIINETIECKYNPYQCILLVIFTTKIDPKHFSVSLLLKCMFDVIDINRNTDDSNSNNISICNNIQCNFHKY